MKNSLKIFISIITLLLIGCGGGSNVSKALNNIDDAVDTTSDAISTIKDANEKVNDVVAKINDKVDGAIDDAKEKLDELGKKELKNHSYVEGIYDISTIKIEDNTTSTAYLSIEDSGLVTTYEFIEAKNCYIKNPKSINNKINGKKLTLDEENKRFYIDDYYWVYGDTKKIQEVSLGIGIIALGLLNAKNTRIASSSKLTTKITQGELNQSLCN